MSPENSIPEVSNERDLQIAIEQEQKAPVLPSINKRVHIDHKGAANTLIKFILSTPNLNGISKKIMVKKICNPGLTNLSIAIELKIRERDVELYEAEGKLVCGCWLKECTSQEAIDRVNANRIIQNEVANIRAEETREGSRLV